MASVNSMPVASGAASAPRLLQAATVICGVLVVAAAFIANYNWIIVHFYRDGAYLLDSGQLADLIWRNPTFNPKFADIFGGEIFNGIHFTPFFNIASALSFVLPIDRVEYYALFEGIVYGSVPLVMFPFLMTTLTENSPLRLAVATIVTLLYSFNAYVLSAIAYPHFEILWPAFAFGFFWMLFTRRIALAAMFFVPALMVREDAGFHLFGFLFMVILADVLRGVPLASQRTRIVFAVLAFGYTVLAVWLQKNVFHHGGLFAQEFLGDPPYAHVSATYLVNQIYLFAKLTPWAPLTALVVVLYAIVDRRPAYLLGTLAVGPWVMLYLMAAEGYVLHSYRTFPLMLAMAWPALEMARAHDFSFPPRAWLWCCGFLASVSLVSLIAFGATFGFRSITNGVFGYQPNKESFAAITRFLDAPGLQERYGRLLMDDSVISLSPRQARVDNRLDAPHDRVDTMLYWQRSHFQSSAAIIAAQRFPYGYRVRGTNVLVASRRDLSRDAYLGDYLEEDAAAHRIFPSQFRVAAWGQITREGVLAPANGGVGPVVFGPYLAIPAGAYEATFDIALVDPAKPGGLALDVVARAGAEILAKEAVTLAPAEVRSLKLRFEVPKRDGTFVEFRVWPNGTALVVKNISYDPVDRAASPAPH